MDSPDKLKNFRSKLEEIFSEEDDFLDINHYRLENLLPREGKYFFSHIEDGKFYLRRTQTFPFSAHDLIEISYNGRPQAKIIQKETGFYTGKDIYVFKGVLKLTST